MKLLVLCAALLCAMPASAQNYRIDAPLEQLIVKEVMKCNTLEQVRSIIQAAVRDGQKASNAAYVRLNSGQKKPVCEMMPLEESNKKRMKLVEVHGAVESFPNELRDIAVLSFKEKNGTTRYIAIERIRVRGFTL